MKFSDLASHRHLLQDFCGLHTPSLLRFKSGSSFKLRITEPDLLDGLRHPTTTATCIESLLECPESFRGDVSESAEELAREFAKAALKLPSKRWQSERSASIYCRCRALPLTIRYSDPPLDARIIKHVKRILAQLGDDQGRFGIGEFDAKWKPPSVYPPNAFHTFWTLEILEEFKEKSPVQYGKLDKTDELGRLKKGMILWARSSLGLQVSLHAADSSLLDSDQLAWSLAILLKFTDEYLTDVGEQDLVREALKGLFKTQLRTGSWRHYRSLFHYRDAGNAYCYVYETFAVLLRIALMEEGHRGQFVRECLHPYLERLIDLWRHVDKTAIRLSEGKRAVGWCSGHRTDVREAEGWATASVFAFAQALRRLVGIWTREEAAGGLPVTRPPVAASQARDKLAERGETWGRDQQSVARQLSTMFINPIIRNRSHSSAEPDSQPVADRQARSAILFGPPGTSKTTLCGCVAAAVDWQYIEVHASHFVAAGLPEVQKTADEIFNRLMELDHAVVLFDEIDELVREREMEHDAFGRFLTTSMLPKLAKLWHQRKVVYFVATNHIQYFDSAITRPQRFDSLVHVGTPSYDAKVRRVGEDLAKQVSISVKPRLADCRAQVEDALKQAASEYGKRDAQLPSELNLAKFALLRFDQLTQLTRLLKQQGAFSETQPEISPDSLRDCLSRIKDQRLRIYAPYMDFGRDQKYERDCQMLNVWRVEGLDPDNLPPGLGFEKLPDRSVWFSSEDSDCPKVSGYSAEVVPPGTVRYIPISADPLPSL